MPRRLRVVVDTNILVSALLQPRSVPRKAFSKANENAFFLASEETLREAEEVLSREAFDRYVQPEERRRFWAAYARKVLLEEITERVEACRDPDDDKFLELAVSGNADVIISGDEDLTVLHPFRGIPILTPSEFLESEFVKG